MKIKDFNKAKEIFEKLQLLEKEIAEIKKLALLISNKNCNINFEIKITDLEKQKDSKSQISFDEDGDFYINGDEDDNDDDNMSQHLKRFMKYPVYRVSFQSGIHEKSKKDKSEKNTNIFNSQITDVSALNIFSFLLLEKNQQCEKYINELKKMGVK